MHARVTTTTFGFPVLQDGIWFWARSVTAGSNAFSVIHEDLTFSLFNGGGGGGRGGGVVGGRGGVGGGRDGFRRLLLSASLGFVGCGGGIGGAWWFDIVLLLGGYSSFH